MKKTFEIPPDKLPQIQLAISVLIVLIYLGLFFSPTLKDFLVSQHKVSQLKKEVKSLKKDWANIDSIKGDIARAKTKLGYYEKKLPSEKGLAAVLENLSGSAKKLDVRIAEIKPVEQEQGSGQIYYSLPIFLRAECGYHQLGRFLNELEKADRFMKISDIKIEPKRPNVLTVQLIIVTYVLI